MSRHVARLPRPHDAGRRGRFTGLVLPRPRPERFAMVPEQLLEADLPATAVRLYGLLLRCPVVDGAHVQSRARLAERLHRSLDTVDRAVGALVNAGWIQVAHRFSDGQQIANAYVVMVMPTPTGGLDQVVASEGSATAAPLLPVDNAPVTAGVYAPADESAAGDDGSAPLRGSRTSAARGAALMRHGRKSLTQRTSSPSPPQPPHSSRGDSSAAALRTHWTVPPERATVRAGGRVTQELIRELARAELEASGLPATRAAVVRRACELLGARASRR